MRFNTHFPNTKTGLRFCLAVGLLFLLQLMTGCDPCMNNPCDDGLACNGVETCTAEGGQAVCGDGTPVECDERQICTEPDGNCEDILCATDSDCDDGDICTTDTCVEGTCDNAQVECAEGESCDPSTGECVNSGAGTATTLLGAAGVYTGTGTCGDDDDEVTLTANLGTLTLSGFKGNDDISLTLTSDTTATAENVVAFGVPGHTLTLTLDTERGVIKFELSTAGSCSTDLVPK